MVRFKHLVKFIVFADKNACVLRRLYQPKYSSYSHCDRSWAKLSIKQPLCCYDYESHVSKRAQWRHLVSAPRHLGPHLGKLKPQGVTWELEADIIWRSVHSHAWQSLLAVGWGLSWAVGWNAANTWPPCVSAWVSSWQSGWVLRVSIPRQRERSCAIFYDQALEVKHSVNFIIVINLPQI